MTDFWYHPDQFHFAPLSRAKFPEYGMAAMNVGFHFVTRPGVWYLFHREYNFAPPPKACKEPVDGLSRIVIRNSTNRGQSWSDPQVVATPSAPADACALTDGSGYFDADTHTWHYLSQCIGLPNAGWDLCHYTLQADHPMSGDASWKPNPHNPVVRSGQLWSRICAGRGKHCSPTTGQEGTPEVVRKDAQGYYYVTFHGYDGKTSARGVAKTKDFVSWETQGHGP